MGPKKIGPTKNLWYKKFWVQRNLGSKNFGAQINFGPEKNFENNFGQKNILELKIFLKKNLGRTFWSTKIMTLEKLGAKSLIIVGPVTVEI